MQVTSESKTIEQGTDESALSYAGWRVAAGSAVGVFVSFASLLVYTFGIFLKPLTEEFSWSRQKASFAFSIAAIMVAVCSPLIGHLLDRFGSRHVLLPCLTVFGCTFASLSLLTPNIWYLYAIFLILGAVGNGTAQLAYLGAVSTWFTRRRGTALAIAMTGGAIGVIILPPLAQALIEKLGWRNAFAAFGFMVLALGLPVVALMVREKPGLRRDRRVETKGSSVRQGVGSRAFWILTVVLFMCSIGQNGAITHLSALLTDRGVTAHDAAIAVSLMGGASLLGRLITGWLLDHFFAARIAFGLLTTAALGIFLLSTAHSMAVGSLAAILIGAGMGGESDVTPYMLARYFGLRSFSMLYGLTWTAYALAGAIGPVLMGRAFDTTASYADLVAKLSALTFAGAALMLALPAYGTYFHEEKTDATYPIA